MKNTIHRKNILCALISGLALLFSCTMFQPEKRSDAWLNLPGKYRMYTEKMPSASVWWDEFHSGELDSLIRMALKGNLTIAETYARIEQAWSTAVKQGAARLPSLDAKAGSSVTRNSEPNMKGDKTEQSHSAGLTASYEIDLWGRIKSTHTAARYDLRAAEEDLYTGAMTLSGEVALAWFEYIAVSKKLAVLKKQLKTNETMQELTLFRYKKGQSTALDVFQQRQTVAAKRASFPKLEARLHILKHELCLLLGRPSSSPLKVSVTDFPEMPELPGAGLPADLLSQRPDVRKSGLLLKSADWVVSAAKANRLPALSISASYTYGSDSVSTIFDNWAANLAANLVGPVFDGGYRKAEVLRTKAIVRERLASYKKTVLTAFKEVEDALVNEKKQAEYIKALREQYRATMDTYEQALEYYRKGRSDYINVLESLNSAQSLELTLIDADFAYYQYRIALCKALGGSWMRKEMKITTGE